MTQPQTLTLDWSQFQTDVGHIADAIHDRLTVDKSWVIYGQPRGGLALALALSHRLGLLLVDRDHLDKYPTTSKNIIYVDDVIETGETFAAFRARYPDRRILGAIWTGKTGRRHVEGELYIRRIVSPDTWVIFPWEITGEAAAQDRQAYNLSRMIPVNDIYPTIQGEGVHTGVPMMLLRLHGCAVGCPFCDTKETWAVDPNEEQSTIVDILGANPKWLRMTGSDIADYIAGYTPSNFKWVLVTGGEPAQYPLTGLVTSLHGHGKMVALETSGTELGFVGAGFDWVCVSPKINMPGGRPFLPATLSHADEIKMVIGKSADINTLIELLRQSSLKPTVQICVQPVSLTERATRLCIEAAQAHNWRLSLQTHRYADIR